MLFLCGGLFLGLALIWAAYDPVAASFEVSRLGSPGADCAKLEASLLRRGRGAVLALRRGAETADLPHRLRCARLLALLGDESYDKVLLAALSLSDRLPAEQSALAEHLMLSVWDRRRGPPLDEAAAALRAEAPAEPAARRPAWQRSRTQLDLLLAQYPAWSSGYVARARQRLAAKEVRAAVEDAVSALYWEPRQFEAIALLGECYLLLDYPEQALEFFDMALAINPRLRPALNEAHEKAREEAAAERERRLIERRKELPVL